MSSIISKASGLVSSVVTKSSEVVNCAVYWSKVGAELSKTIYQKEGLAPPSIKQFETVYQNAFKWLKNPAEQQKVIEQVKSYKPNVQDAVKYGVYGIQLAGFFAVGEIVGRRRIFGYPKLGEEHH
ncbi:ATP20 [Candida theae]|uniref:ATP20 n=1 Tax=Candida theae TaxID=1198502 RepID=A0AAD5FWR0_9ASCO|nr:ATP20 [Candida theae]KAI5949730.1 ATP20 [Candida theae]